MPPFRLISLHAVLVAGALPGCANLLGADFDRPGAGSEPDGAVALNASPGPVGEVANAATEATTPSPAAKDGGGAGKTKGDAAALTCDEAHADCNDSPDDGCEITIVSDPQHCGRCDIACDAGQVCSNGGCVATCAANTTRCGQSCVQLTTNDKHCGACDKACPQVAHATTTCEASACGFTCVDGYNACGGQCVPDSPTQCGASCTACPGTTNGAAACVDGACTFTCANGYARCATGCCPNITAEPRSLALGDDFGCMIVAGKVECWGSNTFGELGDGTETSSSARVKAGSVSTVVALAARDNTACAMRATGTVACWGGNFDKVISASTTLVYPSPVDVPLGASAKEIALTNYNLCLVTTTGGLKCRGDNSFGGLGIGNKTPQTGFVDVPGFASGAAGLNARDLEMIVRKGGDAYSWGKDVTAPTTVPNVDPTDVLVVPAGSSYRLMVSASGALFSVHGVSGAWTKIDVPGDVVDVRAGFFVSCALSRSGEVYCFDSLNTYGERGVGNVNATSRHQVTKVALPSPAVAIDIGELFACAKLQNGELRCWGGNKSGQSGPSSGSVCDGEPCNPTPTKVL